MKSTTVLRVAVLAATSTASVCAAPPALGTLQPGGFRDIPQNLAVNVVFVGYEPGAAPLGINEAAFRAQLPGTYRPIHRYPDFYGIRQYLGLTFNFNYNVLYAPDAWETTFFTHLGALAQPRPLTVFQACYNGAAVAGVCPANLNGALVTTPVGQNHWIDAPSVEAWLAANPPPGVDTGKYTVYLINWYGRPDFKFHVYTKTDEPDPDTGYNFGVIRGSRKMIAWGGTTPGDGPMPAGTVRRVWFYDLSAGPESWTNNYDLVTSDVDGNGSMDYRMPPVWDYGKSGYRPFSDLSGDLGKVTRNVAINLLFTTSPLYKPAISPPKLPATVQVDINLYQGDPAVNGNTYLQPAFVAAKLARLQPWNTFSAQTSDRALASKARDAYLCFLFGPSCYGNRLFGISFGDLFLYHNDHLMQFLEGDANYEVPVFAYNVPLQLSPGGLLGFADDNWRDGTQSFVFSFNDPLTRALGYGLTTTTAHEVGHHLGMSHPHDGFDYEKNVDYGPGDEYYYAWSGDESSSTMSYIDLNFDFSQFDRDNMARYMTVLAVNNANRILGSIYASPRAENVGPALVAADADALAALNAYSAMSYGLAAEKAVSAYRKVLAAAAQINVQVEPQAWQADYKAKGRSSKFIDKLDYHRAAP